MSVLLEVVANYEVIDEYLAIVEQRALQSGDENTFNRANRARQLNDQAYFLYLFTRFEAEVSSAVEDLLARRTDAAIAWTEQRIWQAWSRVRVSDIAFLSKMEVLTDKRRADYATAKRYHDGRNRIAHGGDWDVPFSIPDIGHDMNDLVQRFVTT